MKRVSIRNDKTNKEKIKEVEMKLAESFETVDKIAQENLKYAEENRMLEEILNINKIHESNRENDAENDDEIENDEIIAEVITLLEEEDPFDDDVIEAYLKQAETDSNQEERNIETEEENVAEVIELEDNDDPDDDEVIAFYRQQSLNRAKRNGPMDQASKKKKNSGSSVTIKCKLCDFKGDSQTSVNLHMEAFHTGQYVGTCTKCDFKYKSKIQLEKHNKIVHVGEPRTCWHWENSTCFRGNECKFSHKPSQRIQPRIIPCFYQENCTKPGCRFGHGPFLSNPNGWNQGMWRN